MWIAVLALGLIASGAAVADERGDAEKRRQHAPHVNVLTNCLAASVASDAVAMSLADAGQWELAIVRVGTSCRAQAATMISKHDQLYGAGTGAVFLRGAYIGDVARVVRMRLQPLVEQRRRAAAAAERVRAPQPASASRLVN